MSHKSKYYAKKLRKVDSKGVKTLNMLWRNTENKDDITERSTNENASSTPPPSCSTGSNHVDDVHDEARDTGKRSCNSLSKNSDAPEPPSKDRHLVDSLPIQYNYPWVYYNITKSGYICKYCELFPVQTAKGDSKWSEVGVDFNGHLTRRLEKHNNSEHHQQSEKYYKTSQANFEKKALQKSGRKTSVYDQLKEQAESQSSDEIYRNREVIKKLFRTIYFISRKHWSQTSFEELVRFVASIGVEDLQSHIDNAPPNATYLSDKIAGEMIDIIGNYLENKLLSTAREADFFTLYADESTDEQNREQMVVFIKWPLVGTVNQAHFAGIINVEKTDAETLMNAVRAFCIGKGLDLAKCRFVAFDGANVMSGEVSGLQKRIRHESPLSLYVNCRNHRLALCLKHLMKDYPLLVEADEALLAIWKMFHYSPQRFAVFKNVQGAYGEKPITLKRAAATRWLSHGQACKRLIDRYVECIDTLDEIYASKREPEVNGVRTAITNKNTVSMILLLCDVLQPVNTLSEFLQQDDINLMDVDAKACTNELEELRNKITTREDDTMYFKKCTVIMDEITERTTLARRHRGKNFLTVEDFVQEKAIPFINSLVGEITDAFSCHPVFQAFMVLDPRNLPENVDDLPMHGEQGIRRLAEHYGVVKEDVFRGHVSRGQPDIDSANLLQTEFTGFKHQMFMFRASVRQNLLPAKFGPYELLAKMEADPVLRVCFPRIYRLVQMMSIIPTSTAIVERSFSRMNLLCTTQQSSLLQQKLSSLMMICLEGPDQLSEYDLDTLCNQFRDQKPRKMLL